MDFDLGNAWDSIKDGTKEITEVAHAKTSEFHDKYVSKVLPDCGKYGDAVKFVAEMAPGVEEYNAIVEGDWTAFAIAAGIDIAALAAGAVTAGAGYTAIKGATSVAKTGVKVAVKEIAESGAKKAVKKVVKESTEKAIKEVAEEGTEKIVKEVAEQTAEKVTKEVVETGVEKTAKEVVETGVEKATKETVEAGTEKAAKETAEAGAEKTVRYIECRNKGLAGDRHPMTGVEFVEKTVDDGTGELVKGVFPKFNSKFDTRISENLYKSSNVTQFKEANKHLLENVENNSSLRRLFSEEQIEQIKDGIHNGTAPDGYIWHHNEEAGVLQLVDLYEHVNTGHTGGRAIWGGGY